MDQHIRSARGSAVAALIARIGNADFSGREFVSETKKPAVGTSVGAETLRSQKINGHEAADKKERNGDGDGGKGFPKVRRDKMIGEFRNKRFVLRLGDGSIEYRPTEHI